MELIVGASILASIGSAGGVAMYKNNLKVNTDKYDVVLTIESLKKISSGWKSTFPIFEDTKSESEKAKSLTGALKSMFVAPPKHTPDELIKVIKSEHPKKSIVSVLGLYNRGKSYLLSKLFNMNFESSYFKHTEGLSVILSRGTYSETIVGLDTKGSNKPVYPKDDNPSESTDSLIKDAEATEKFLQSLSFSLSDVVIIVVNSLTRDDQLYISQMKQMLSSDPKTQKKIIIVHNLINVKTIAELNTVVKEDIEKSFNATLIDGDTDPYWSSFDQTRHVVLAMDESSPERSEAGKIWNTRTINLLNKWLSAAASHNLYKFTLFERIVKFTNDQIGNYLVALPEEEIDNQGLKKTNNNSHHRDVNLDSQVSLRVKFNDETKTIELEKELPKGYVLEYADIRFNLVGIISENLNMNTNRYKVIQDPSKIYIALDITGFSKDDLHLEVHRDDTRVTVSSLGKIKKLNFVGNPNLDNISVLYDGYKELNNNFHWEYSLNEPCEKAPNFLFENGVLYLTFTKKPAEGFQSFGSFQTRSD